VDTVAGPLGGEGGAQLGEQSASHLVHLSIESNAA